MRDQLLVIYCTPLTFVKRRTAHNFVFVMVIVVCVCVCMYDIVCMWYPIQYDIVIFIIGF
jgi:hypothetical protein